VGGDLLSVAWVLWLQFGAWGIGRTIYRRLVPPSESPEVECDAVYSAALGFAALAWGAFVLGVAHLLFAPLLLVLGLAAGLWGAAQAWRSRGPGRFSPSRAHAPLILAVVFAASHLPNALYPVLEHDDNTYHLFIPKAYLAGHALVSLPSLLYANMPHLVELLYTIPAVIDRLVAARVLTFSFSFWTMAALYLATRRRLGPFAAGLLPLLYVSGKNIQWHLGLGYVEPVIGFQLLVACLALLEWHRTRHRGLLRVVAVACGFAAASKYTAWFFVAALLGTAGLLIMRARELGPRSRRVGELTATAGLAAIFVVPWLIKQAVVTGNPIYPNLYRIFGGAFWSEVQSMQFLHSQLSYAGVHKTVVDYLLVPWRLMAEDNFFVAPSVSQSLMVLWLASLLLTALRRSRAALLPLLSLAGFLAWEFSVEQGRFLVAWIPVMVLATAPVLEPLLRRGKVLVALFVAMIWVGGSQIVTPAFPWTQHWEIFTTPRAELEQKNLYYNLCAYLNKNVPPGRRVYGFWENRFYFLDRPFHCDSAWEAPTSLAELRAADDPGEFARRLEQTGYSHVVINPGPAESYLTNKLGFDLLDPRIYPQARLDRDRELVKDFVSRYLEPECQFGGTVVYRLKADVRSP